MTNYDRFTVLEKRRDEEREKIREMALIEDTHKMYWTVNAQCKKVSEMQKELNYMLENVNMDAEYKPSLIEEILGIDLEPDGV